MIQSCILSAGSLGVVLTTSDSKELLTGIGGDSVTEVPLDGSCMAGDPVSLVHALTDAGPDISEW